MKKLLLSKQEYERLVSLLTKVWIFTLFGKLSGLINATMHQEVHDSLESLQDAKDVIIMDGVNND